MKLHVQVVIHCILNIIEQGGTHMTKVDLQEVHKKVLTLQKKNSSVKKKPGFRHYPTHLYEEKFGGALAMNGYLSKGHRSWNMDGVEGVLVPD